METLRFVVERPYAGMRLDQFLARQIPHRSRARLREEILIGQCSVNDRIVQKADYRVREDEVVVVRQEERETSLRAEEGTLEILYSDETLCVLNKPANLTVHPCPSCPSNTLIQRLLRYFPSLACMPGERPGIVHRLDKDTSGLLVVALTEACRLSLAAAFAGRQVVKEYLALVAGEPPSEGTCSEPIGRHPTQKTRMCVLPERQGGRAAKTAWTRLWLAPERECALVRVRISTGRTHQIRVHMQHLGYPLLGDQVYAPPAVAKMAPRQMLHAHRLSFIHPERHTTCTFQCPPPNDFCTTAMQYTNALQRVVVTGNPGSGKSTLMALFRAKGIPCFSADDAVAALYAKNGAVSSWLAANGAHHVLEQDGAIDRNALFALFQKDPAYKRAFEETLHTSVRAELLAFWERYIGKAQRAIAEIPLWFECAWQVPFPVVTICVHCPQEMRFARLQQTRGWTREKSETIEGWQWDAAKKEAASTLCVDNSGAHAALVDQVEAVLLRLDEEQKTIHDREVARLDKCMDRSSS